MPKFPWFPVLALVAGMALCLALMGAYPVPTHWEYRILYSYKFADMVQHLNAADREGWQVVTMSNTETGVSVLLRRNLP